MITIILEDNKVEILGHGSDTYCARISTLVQFTIKLLKHKITKQNINRGYTFFTFKRLDKHEKYIYYSFITALQELKKMNGNTIIENRLKEGINNGI